MVTPHDACDVSPLGDWTDPQPETRRWGALVPQVDADGNETSGIRLPELAVPTGTFAGWNIYRAPHPAGELADRDGSFLAFAATEAERGGDPRASQAQRYPGDSRSAALRGAAAALLRDGLLLPEDAAVWGA